MISTRQAERRSVGLPGRSYKGPVRHLCKRAGAVGADGDEATVMLQTIEYADRRARAHRPAERTRRWVSARPYREPSLGRSLAELVVTVVPFVALWLLMLASLALFLLACLLLPCRRRASSCACS